MEIGANCPQAEIRETMKSIASIGQDITNDPGRKAIDRGVSRV